VPDKATAPKLRAESPRKLLKEIVLLSAEQELDRAVEGGEEALAELLARYEARRHSMPIFMKELKQRFARWFNRQHSCIAAQLSREIEGFRFRRKRWARSTGAVCRREVYADVTGREFTLPKERIASVQQLSPSLMPPDLPRNMTLLELRDLVAYLIGP